MKKALSILLLLLIALSLFAGCGKKKTEPADPASPPQESTSDTGDPSVPPSNESPTPSSTFPTDGSVAVTKDETSVKVTMAIPSLAGKELSLVLIKDPAYRYTWAEDPAARLCGISQICLDDKGEGTATLTPSAQGSAYLVITTEDGASTTLPVN